MVASSRFRSRWTLAIALGLLIGSCTTPPDALMPSVSGPLPQAQP